jgi:hypothetical protein
MKGETFLINKPHPPNRLLILKIKYGPFPAKETINQGCGFGYPDQIQHVNKLFVSSHVAGTL